MLTNRLNAFLPARALSTEIDRVIEDFWRALPGTSSVLGRRGFPAANVWESADSLHAEFELPGMKLEDLELEVKGNELSLRGEFKEESGESVSYHRRERGSGAFSRVLRMPVEIDAEKVEARMDRGVLTIDLPKALGARARKIPIQRSEG